MVKNIGNIKKLREALDGKKISAPELANSYLEAIAAKDETLGAYLHVNEDNVNKMAQAAQKRIDSGEKTALLGVPIGLKDALCTTDMPTTCASKFLEGYVSPYDATVVKKLREAGAVFTGKLNMDEFAMGSSNMNSAYKRAKNPYKLDCVTGGSSGGSAAAVAGAMCAAALGTDTGGSIRQPASFCGITGLRPTYGMVSRYGCVAYASSLDQIGPMAMSAEDCEMVLDVISGHDPNDMMSARDIGGRPKVTSLKGIKLGVVELTDDIAKPETKESVLAAVEWYRKNGAEIEYVRLPQVEYCVPAYFLISCAEASANFGRFDGVRYGVRTKKYADYDELISKSRAEGFGREVQRRILLGVYSLCAGNYDEYYQRAVGLAHKVKNEYRNIFEKYDALLSPVSPDAAWVADSTSVDPAQGYMVDICTAGASLAGLPALSTPCGYTSDGRPIGLQIIGNRFDDKFLLSLAHLFEQEFERKEAIV